MLLEKLFRHAAGNLSMSAAKQKFDTFVGEIGLADVDIEHDA